jgi:hypothetical protein
MDVRNDGQLLTKDELIPGSILLGYANADHWAVAIRIEDALPFWADRKDGVRAYPQDDLLRSILIYVQQEILLKSSSRSGQRYMIQPWGEQFVQRLFNTTEREYPIIDNVSPESVGAKYRYANRKVVGTVADLARFIAFNLFETSIIQKIHVLGDDAGHDQQPAWDIPFARSQGLQTVFGLAGRRRSVQGAYCRTGRRW